MITIYVPSLILERGLKIESKNIRRRRRRGLYPPRVILKTKKEVNNTHMSIEILIMNTHIKYRHKHMDYPVDKTSIGAKR